MDTTKMKYPFGRCYACRKEFNSELRNEYEITHCPWCGVEIDDFMAPLNPRSNDEIYCEDCGKTIFRGGTWIEELGKNQAGVCFGPCERELCGDCGDWDDEGCCHECHLKDPSELCADCPKENCDELPETCKYPCATCPMKNDCFHESNDKRHECQAFIEFNEKECGKKTRECPCGYIGDDFAKREVNESDAVFSCGQAEIWICPDCGKEIAETREEA